MGVQEGDCQLEVAAWKFGRGGVFSSRRPQFLRLAPGPRPQARRQLFAHLTNSERLLDGAGPDGYLLQYSYAQRVGGPGQLLLGAWGCPAVAPVAPVAPMAAAPQQAGLAAS